MDPFKVFTDHWRQMQKQLELHERQLSYLMRQSIQDPDEWLIQAYQQHRGKRCFLVGTGPSLNKLDLSKLQNEVVMACNGAILIEELNINYFISVSHYFYKSHFERINSYSCERFFLPYYLHDLVPQTPTSWLQTLEFDQYQNLNLTNPYRFSTDIAQTVFLGGTVIYPALQILHYLGFDEVILIGVDHNYGPMDESKTQIISSSDLKAHFTRDYYTQPTQVYIDFPAMNRAYQLAKEAYDRSERRILNATPGSKLNTYPRVQFDSLF